MFVGVYDYVDYVSVSLWLCVNNEDMYPLKVFITLVVATFMSVLILSNLLSVDILSTLALLNLLTNVLNNNNLGSSTRKVKKF